MLQRNPVIDETEDPDSRKIYSNNVHVRRTYGHIVAQGSNPEYTTAFHLCGLIVHLCEPLSCLCGLSLGFYPLWLG